MTETFNRPTGLTGRHSGVVMVSGQAVRGQDVVI